MLIGVTVHVGGEMPLTCSTNLAFIRPGPDIPIKVSLEYCEGAPNGPDCERRMEIRAIHFATRAISQAMKVKVSKNIMQEGGADFFTFLRKLNICMITHLGQMLKSGMVNVDQTWILDI